MTDISFRNLGKQKKVKYVYYWHFFFFSNILTWPVSKCAFVMCDKALNWRTHKNKKKQSQPRGKKGCSESISLSVKLGKTRCSPIHMSLFAALFLALGFGFFSPAP